MDGVTERNDNWAIAPLHSPVLIEFGQALDASALRVHLYDADQRRYRFRLEVRTGAGWQVLAEGAGEPLSGVQEFPWQGDALSAVRITGLYSSVAEQDPGNAYLHIKELEIIR
jgi:hypothetical protein